MSSRIAPSARARSTMSWAMRGRLRPLRSPGMSFQYASTVERTKCAPSGDRSISPKAAASQGCKPFCGVDAQSAVAKLLYALSNRAVASASLELKWRKSAGLLNPDAAAMSRTLTASTPGEAKSFSAWIIMAAFAAEAVGRVCAIASSEHALRHGLGDVMDYGAVLTAPAARVHDAAAPG